MEDMMEDIRHDGSETEAQMISDENEVVQALLPAPRRIEVAYRRPWLGEPKYFVMKKLTDRLPTEIISMIFEFSMPADIIRCDLSVARREYTMRAPLILSAVCQKWRNIARATPRLWTQIPLRLRQANANSLPSLAEDWLRLSGSWLPLSINLFVAIEEVGVEDLRKLVQVITPYCARWRDVRYHGFYDNLADILSSGLHLGQLRSLRVIMAFNNCIWKRHDNQGLKCFDNCLELLRRAPQLHICGIAPLDVYYLINAYNTYPPPSQVYSPQHLKHSNITRLVLQGHYSCDILSHMVCPSLTEIKLVGPEFNTRSPLSHAFAFIRRSTCTITALHIFNVDLEMNDIELICRDLTSLTHLTLELYKPVCQLDDRIFTLLSSMIATDYGVVPQYLPQLQFFILRQDDIFSRWSMLPLIFFFPRSSIRCRTQLTYFKIEVGMRSMVTVEDMGIGRLTREKLMLARDLGVDLSVVFGRNMQNLLV